MRIVFFGDSITDAGRNREDEMSLGRYGYGFVHDVSSTLMYQEPNKYQKNWRKWNLQLQNLKNPYTRHLNIFQKMIYKIHLFHY